MIIKWQSLSQAESSDPPISQKWTQQWAKLSSYTVSHDPSIPKRHSTPSLTVKMKTVSLFWMFSDASTSRFRNGSQIWLLTIDLQKDLDV